MNKKEYTSEELLFNTSFHRWARGDAGTEETEEWNRWVQENERNRDEARKALEMISGFRFAEPEMPDLDEEWSAVRNRLKHPNRTNAGNSRILTGGYDLKWFFRVAAILLVVFLASWFVLPDYFTGDPEEAEQVVVQTIATDFGEKKTISLSDGSRIVLAAGSRLTYTSDWLARPTKRIKLEGEALFSIVPSPAGARPKFVVDTEDGSAAVWGTKFSVSTYGKGTRIVLEEGEVRVNVAGLEEKMDHLKMTPGQLANFTRSDRNISVEIVNPAVYNSWASDKLVFDNTPISYLVERIQRTYDVEIEIMDQEVLDKKLSGSVNFKDLDSLIRAVSEVLKINISRTERTVFIYGNESKSNRVNQ